MSKNCTSDSGMIYHLLCYYGKTHIGTTVTNFDNLFDHLERFFGWTIEKVVVVETGQKFYNSGGQLELF